jgi:hypothetical protein
MNRDETREGRKEGRMYYCGGPTKEQAGSVPTYSTSRLYATDVNGSFAVKTYLPSVIDLSRRELRRWGGKSAIQNSEIYGEVESCTTFNVSTKLWCSRTT